MFELGPQGRAGVCQTEDREGCCWWRGVQSGHVSSPEDSEEWVWQGSPAHLAMHVFSIFGEQGRRGPRRAGWP